MIGHNVCFKGAVWKIISFTLSYLEHCQFMGMVYSAYPNNLRYFILVSIYRTNAKKNCSMHAYKYFSQLSISRILHIVYKIILVFLITRLSGKTRNSVRAVRLAEIARLVSGEPD